jgi:acetyl esterase/lipase
MNDWTRREFLESSAAVVSSVARTLPVGSADDLQSFTVRQIMRRRKLWGLLGDLPWKHRPGPPQLVRKEEHDGYTLERLVLDLNGVEKVPALLLIPHKRQPKAPGLLYIHWHGGMYDLGKEQLLKGVDAQPA